MSKKETRKAKKVRWQKEARLAREGPDWVRRLSELPVIGPAVGAWHRALFDLRLRRQFARDNRPARRAFAAQPPTLDATQARVLDALRARGFVSVPVTDLLPSLDFPKLVADVELWLASPDVRAREAAYQSTDTRRWKDYIVRLYGRDSVIPWTSPWLQIGIERRIVDIVNTYHGLWAHLTYVDVWNTVPLEHDGPDAGSQRWHRDPEDSRLIKVFLYLNDVDADAGPMEYVPNSRRGDKYGHLWPQTFPGGSVPPEGEVERVIPESDRALCTGSLGTLMFVDTTGFHRGGRATRHRRVLATWTYSTPASMWPRAFVIADKPSLKDDPSGFALS